MNMTSEILQLQRELNQIIRKEAVLLRVQLLAHEAGSLADCLIQQNNGTEISRRETQILSLVSRISGKISQKPSEQRLSELFKRLSLIELYAVGMVQNKVDRPSLQ